MNGTENPPARTSARRWTPRLRAGLTMAALALAAAVISYTDGLFLVREAGNGGGVAYLYPLLPDGLIVICLISLYDAAAAKAPRPGWATAGVVFGAVLTVAMNLAAGLAHSPLDALVDALVPLVFFVAVEVLIGLIRRGRGPVSPIPHGGAPVTCPHTAGTSLAEAVRHGFAHLRECEGERVTQAEFGARFGLSRKQVGTMLRGVPEDAPEPSLNGSGPGGG